MSAVPPALRHADGGGVIDESPCVVAGSSSGPADGDVSGDLQLLPRTRRPDADVAGFPWHVSIFPDITVSSPSDCSDDTSPGTEPCTMIQ